MIRKLWTILIFVPSSWLGVWVDPPKMLTHALAFSRSEGNWPQLVLCALGKASKKLIKFRKISWTCGPPPPPNRALEGDNFVFGQIWKFRFKYTWGIYRSFGIRGERILFFGPNTNIDVYIDSYLILWDKGIFCPHFVQSSNSVSIRTIGLFHYSLPPKFLSVKWENL